MLMSNQTSMSYLFFKSDHVFPDLGEGHPAVIGSSATDSDLYTKLEKFKQKKQKKAVAVDIVDTGIGEKIYKGS